VGLDLVGYMALVGKDGHLELSEKTEKKVVCSFFPDPVGCQLDTGCVMPLWRVTNQCGPEDCVLAAPAPDLGYGFHLDIGRFHSNCCEIISDGMDLGKIGCKYT